MVHLRSSSWRPLIYRRQIDRAVDVRPGDFVSVYSGGNEPVGYGLYNPRSELALRMLWRGARYPSLDDWTSRLRRAVAFRREFLRLETATNAWRVIHAEADELSGFVVDRYGDVLSAEVFSLAIYQRASILMPMLADICDLPHWIVRPSPRFLSQEGCDPPPLMSEGCPSQVTITEHGTRFRVRFDDSHKTGFFCDQRDNRRRLAGFCSGRSVLDLCCYTGGFSLHAARQGQAGEVTGVDLDEAALSVARRNANLNQVRVRFVQADVFAWMREMIRNDRRFDVVVLDPPKLIRTRLELEDGTRKHYALNKLALQLVRPGGLLLTCSCAGLLPEPEFIRLVVAASRGEPEPDAGEQIRSAWPAEGRTLRIIERTGAAPDHPVISTCPETEYLKAIWCVVD